MNTPIPTRAGARLGAGVFFALLLVTLSVVACASTRAGASPPRTPRAAERPAPGGHDLRIRIARSVASIRFDADVISISVPNIRGRISEPGPVTVTREGDNFSITGRDSANPLTFRGPIVLAPPEGGTLRVDDGEHLGAVEILAADTPGAFDAVELIDIESYLPGVIAAELYPGWSPVAYEAQAVAARSYALHERSRRRAAGDAFDLENTTIDQAYAGAKSSPKAREAVLRTRGLVLQHQGGILRAYYSSSCGGRPASARDTWPTEGEFAFNLAPPLQARQRPFACGFSQHFSWSVTRGVDDLTQRLAGAGDQAGQPIRELQRLESILPIEWNIAGRPSLYEVRDVSGKSWRLQADTLRHRLNASVPGRPDVSAGERLRSGDIDVVIAGDVAQIAGRGFGHGVGLCQFGAEGFARRGWSRDRILRLYYPGAEITALY